MDTITRPSTITMYAVAALIAAVLLYLVYADTEDGVPATQANVQHDRKGAQANGQTLTAGAVRTPVPTPAMSASASASALEPAVRPTAVDLLSDPRLTEAALAHDDDHYSLPSVMRNPPDPHAASRREHIAQFLEQADAEEASLQKQIDMATLKARSKEDVARLQSQLDQLRKQREAIILKNISILDGSFFHD